MSLRALALFVVATNTWAECTLVQDTVATSSTDIARRETLTQQIFEEPHGKVCSVGMKFLVGSEWYTAVGEATWTSDITKAQACGLASARAEQKTLDRIGKMKLSSTRVLSCDDDRPHQNFDVGSIAPLTAYRGHPEYPKSFVHNGTECRFFLDSQFTGEEVYTYQGVICRVNGGWAVVDKF